MGFRLGLCLAVTGPVSGSVATAHPHKVVLKTLAFCLVGGLPPIHFRNPRNKSVAVGPGGNSLLGMVLLVVWPQVPDLEILEDSLLITLSPSQGLGSRESPKSIHLV